VADIVATSLSPETPLQPFRIPSPTPSGNIGNVADAIAKSIAPKVKTKNFPEDFRDVPLDTDFHISRELVKAVHSEHFLDQLDIVFYGEGFEATYPKPVGEAAGRTTLPSSVSLT